MVGTSSPHVPPSGLPAGSLRGVLRKACGVRAARVEQGNSIYFYSCTLA